MFIDKSTEVKGRGWMMKGAFEVAGRASKYEWLSLHSAPTTAVVQQ